MLGGIAAKLRQKLGPIDADLLLQGSMAALIELAATRYAVDPGARWRPGEPLKLLFVGYAGSRNTGADVRVEEMLRQFRHLLGDEHVELSILTIDPARTRGYFPTVRQLTLPPVFPGFLFDVVHQQHGVIACEGSMFKSKFANALTTLMVGGLGLATAENKIAVAYGGEAGAMDPAIEAMVRRYCRDALVIPRNRESEEILGRLGIQTRPGTDTAWTYQAGAERGRAVLKSAGWDGKMPVLAVCPINPFWWPVKPDLLKGLGWACVGAFEREHYRSIYFHASSADIRRKQDVYLHALAGAIERFTRKERAFVVLVGMEMLDRYACEGLAARMQRLAPLLVSDEHDHRTMVSVLRASSYVVSSRYHALVCSMPAGVPGIGVTMDERIPNLMADKSTPELALRVDDPDLEDRLVAALEQVRDRRETIVEGILACVERNRRRMGEMGMALVDHLRERHPELPIPEHLGSHGDPLDHLPPDTR